MISGPLITASESMALFDRAIFLDARAGPGARAHYLRGHVPGARYADLESDLSRVGDPQRGGRHPLPPLEDWLARVGRWGVRPSTPVLVYDADNGGMAAARAWWMLRAIGHAPLAVVDGGWAALERAGVPSEVGEPVSEAAPPYPGAVRAWPAIDVSEVDRVRGDPDWRLIDARAPERFEGRVEPIDPIAGHIPGAINMYWKSLVSDTGEFVSTAEIGKRLDALLSNTPPERVVCYCGSGVTACHLLLAMEVSQLGGAHLYVGSWSEWCRTRHGAISPQ
jgi:thiosulfate/3-mercaptopyruvate sulfurtransferase